MAHSLARTSLVLSSALALTIGSSCGGDGAKEVPEGAGAFGGTYSAPPLVTGGATGAGATAGTGATAGPVADASAALGACEPGAWDCACEPGTETDCTCPGGEAGVMRCRPSGAGFAECDCGVDAGPDGAVPNPRLGSACSTHADCGAGLACLQADSAAIEGGGPAAGLCTRDCSDDVSVCAAIGANFCIGFPDQTSDVKYCLERCDFGTPADAGAKCHGRLDVACGPRTIDLPTGREIVGVCFPNCNSDADCGTGLFCNGATGLCEAAANAGDPVGTPCTAGAASCAGFCRPFDLDGMGTVANLCSERCTLGRMDGQCGWSGTGPADAACVYSEGAILQSGTVPGAGDVGSCGQLCDCNADCLDASLICRAQAVRGRAGLCESPFVGDGGMDPGIPTCP